MQELTDIVQIKHEVLCATARHAFAGDIYEEYDRIPFELIKGIKPNFRCCVYREREIIHQRVRMAIQQGNLNLAEELLNAQSDHDAEWNFLKGAICYRRGWLDDARRYYQTAVQMDPDNVEYQRALDVAEGRDGYRPNGYSTMTTTSCGNADCLRLCGATLCCNALGVPVCFC